MLFTRQFRALLKFAALWAIPWCGMGVAFALLRWYTSSPNLPAWSIGGWVLLHMAGYGALGLISGLDVGLLLARAERGRRVDQLSPRRVALWGILGGAGPAALFAALGVIFGAPATVYLPLLGLGVVSATISAGLAVSVVHAAKRAPLPPGPDLPPLKGT